MQEWLISEWPHPGNTERLLLDSELVDFSTHTMPKFYAGGSIHKEMYAKRETRISIFLCHFVERIEAARHSEKIGAAFVAAINHGVVIAINIVQNF